MFVAFELSSIHCVFYVAGSDLAGVDGVTPDLADFLEESWGQIEAFVNNVYSREKKPKPQRPRRGNDDGTTAERKSTLLIPCLCKQLPEPPGS